MSFVRYGIVHLFTSVFFHQSIKLSDWLSDILMDRHRGYKIFPRFLIFFIFRPAPVAYGSSQARGWVRTVAAGLHHSHSNARSLTHERVQGLNPHPHGS